MRMIVSPLVLLRENTILQEEAKSNQSIWMSIIRRQFKITKKKSIWKEEGREEAVALLTRD